MQDLATAVNHQIRLAARPVGLPKDSDWQFTTEPVVQPADGGVLVRTLSLSLDPAMRGWMNEGKSYIPPVGIGEVMRAGGIGVVVASKNPAFAVGDRISAGLGGLAYAGMPATHRDTNHSVIFLTGHDATGAMPANVNWSAIAKASPVIVMYMAVKHLSEIAAALIDGGRESDDPVTIVANATMPNQQVFETTLGGADRFLADNEPPTPAIVVVGRIAQWRRVLDWYRGALAENPIG